MSSPIASIQGGPIKERVRQLKWEVLRGPKKDGYRHFMLKEISYIHAEGYAAGEMKHGPLALVDERMPVVCIALRDSVYEKMVSNIQEVKARKGKVIAVATQGDEEIKKYADHCLFIPHIREEFSPILAALPLQLLAYQIAIKRGCHVDQPRNLAKSVTVE